MTTTTTTSITATEEEKIRAYLTGLAIVVDKKINDASTDKDSPEFCKKLRQEAVVEGRSILAQLN